MAGELAIETKKLINTLRREVQELCDDTAQRVLGKARINVPQISTAPYATNALRESGYVVDDKGSSYADAISEAKWARYIAVQSGETHFLTRALSTRDILPPIRVERAANHPRAMVDYPLAYAMAIHEGFVGPTGEPVESRPFLQEAVDVETNDFLLRMEGIGERLESIHAKTKAEKKAAWQSKADQRYENRVLSDALAWKADANQTKLERLRAAGYTDEAVKRAKQSGLTTGEAGERVRGEAESIADKY